MDLDELKSHPLLAELPEHMLQALAKQGNIIELKKGEVLYRDTDPIKHSLFILSGKLAVIKKIEESGNEYPIEIFKSHQAIAEAYLAHAVFDHSQVVAIADSRVFLCPKSLLSQLIVGDESHRQTPTPFYMKLSHSFCFRLKQLYEGNLIAAEEELEFIKERARYTTYILYIIMILSVYGISVQWLHLLLKTAVLSTFISAPFTLLLLLVVLRGAYQLGYSLRDLGLSLSNWRQALKDVIVFTTPIILIISGIEYGVIHYNILSFAKSSGPLPNLWLTAALNFTYFIVVIPTQELIFRGIMQNGLEQVIASTNRTWYAILGSNLIFSTIHSLYSPVFSIAAFFLGLYLGWLFSRTRTILAPILGHAIIAWWFIYVLDLQDLLWK